MGAGGRVSVSPTRLMHFDCLLRAQVCYAISQLAAGFKDDESSPLSPYFKDIIQALLETVGAAPRGALTPLSILQLHSGSSCRIVRT